MRKLVCVVAVCFLMFTILSGCKLLDKFGLGNDDELCPASSIVMNEEEAKKLSDKIPVHLYFANEENTRLKLEVRYLPVEEAKKSVNNLASCIVRELIKGPVLNKALKATVPQETKLLTPVAIKSGIATVNLSKDFVSKHPGGKANEQLTIYSIVNSLTELKEIEKVKFLIEGKKQKEFKGNYKFDASFPRTPSLISKETIDIPGLTANSPAPSKDSNEKSKGDEKDKGKSPESKKQDSSKENKKDEVKKKSSDSGLEDSGYSSGDLDDGSIQTDGEILE